MAMRCQALFGAVLGTTTPSCSSSSQCEPVHSFPHKYGPSQCMTMSLAWTPNACRSWKLSNVSRSRFQITRRASEKPSEVVTDVKVEGVEDVEEDEYPLWMDEDDPSWPEDDPDGEGYGFRISNFFEPKIKDAKGEKPLAEDDELNLNWDEEKDEWIVREITSLEWDHVAIEDPTPLIFLAFERYGPSGAESWKLLTAVETVLKSILDSRKYPIRAVKLDISQEPAVGAALKVKVLPSLLFIKGGKLLYRLLGLKTSEEIMAVTSHLFYHSVRPEFMDDLDPSHKVTSISASG